MLIYEPTGFMNPIANIGKMEISQVKTLLNKQLVIAELLDGIIITAINIISLIVTILHSVIYSSRHGTT